MSPPDPNRRTAIRAVMQAHVDQCLHKALSKVVGKDAGAENQRNKHQALFQLQSLLESGAECAGQIQLATHIVKGIHPDLKVKSTSNLKVDTSRLPDQGVLGSHVLGTTPDVDTTGNGAFNKKVYELFRLLEVRFEQQTILELLKGGDADAVAALSDDPSVAAKLATELVDIDVQRCTRPASHALAKQLYWPVGDDPHDDRNYHLLAPLYPTSLVQRVYQTLHDDRFSDEANAAREARKAGLWHERPVREYPNLAIQKLGGTKPQNISHLNSERRGDNVLLASLPPVWQSPEVRPVFGVESLFTVFRRRSEVRRLTELLRRFLGSDPARNLATRAQRDTWVGALLDELLQFATEQQSLEPGWSQQPSCQLRATHAAWLDPDGASDTPPDLTDELARDFALWLNHELRASLPVGDDEFEHWRRQARELFKALEREEAP